MIVAGTVVLGVGAASAAAVFSTLRVRAPCRAYPSRRAQRRHVAGRQPVHIVLPGALVLALVDARSAPRCRTCCTWSGIRRVGPTFGLL